MITIVLVCDLEPREPVLLKLVIGTGVGDSIDLYYQVAGTGCNELLGGFSQYVTDLTYIDSQWRGDPW